MHTPKRRRLSGLAKVFAPTSRTPHPIPGCPQRKSNLFYLKIWHCKFEESVGVAGRGATVWRGCGSADLVGPLAFANLPSIGLLVRRSEDASSLSLLGVSFVGFRASLVLISLVAHLANAHLRVKCSWRQIQCADIKEKCRNLSHLFKYTFAIHSQI